MTMIVPTGTTTAVDPCDCLYIQPRTVGLANYATLYVATGAPILVDALPADLAEELDEAAFGEGSELTLWTEATAFAGPSPLLVAGAQVRSIQPSPDELGSLWRLAQSEVQLYAAAVNVAAALELVNACSACGAGGGSGGGGEALEWAPEAGGTNTTGALTVVQSTAIAVPYPDSDVEVVTLTVGVTGTSAADGNTTVTIPLPRTCDAQTVAVAQGDPGGGALSAVSGAADADTLTFTFTGQEDVGFGVWCVLQYESGAE